LSPRPIIDPKTKCPISFLHTLSNNFSTFFSLKFYFVFSQKKSLWLGRKNLFLWHFRECFDGCCKSCKTTFHLRKFKKSKMWQLFRGGQLPIKGLVFYLENSSVVVILTGVKPKYTFTMKVNLICV
jgi:hypothetical protein